MWKIVKNGFLKFQIFKVFVCLWPFTIVLRHDFCETRATRKVKCWCLECEVGILKLTFL